MPKVIGVVGSRRRASLSDYEAVRAAITAVYEPGDSLVSGGCPEGADRFCEHVASGLGLPVVKLSEGEELSTQYAACFIHPALWQRYGRQAGFRRNTYIARDAQVLIACVAPDRKGGTEDTIRKWCEARPGSIPTLV